MDESYAVPKAKKVAVAAPVYPSSDAERFDGLQQLLEGCLAERNYQDLANIAALAHRFQQLMHITYRIDDLIANGPRRHRR